MIFRLREGLELQGVHRAGQLFGQQGIDHPLAREAGFPFEGAADDFDAKIGLAFRPGADMAGVQVGLVDDR